MSRKGFRLFSPMPTTSTPIARPLAVALLLLIAVVFAGNHIAARLAFDHGTNVLTAVAFRSLATALAVALLMRLTRVPFALHGAAWWQVLVFGLIILAQSFFLYSAVARIPVALALLTFNTFPIMLAIISWFGGGERPARRVAIAMPIALFGLTMALGVMGGSGIAPGPGFTAGVGFALGASFSFAVTLFLTTRWFKAVDGRMRSFIGMGVVGAVALAAGLGMDGFALPRDSTGWLGLALLTVFYGTAITSLFVLLPRMGMVNNAALMNFEPVAALMLGWLILDQMLQPSQIAGVAVVIGAIVMVATAKR